MIIGIWLGFQFPVSIQREGIGRFSSFLVKALAQYSEVKKFEVWCYTCNKADVEALFAGVPKVDIITLDIAESTLKNTFLEGLDKCCGMLSSNTYSFWREPSEKIKILYGLDTTKKKLLYWFLFFLGFTARAIRRFILKNKLQYPILENQDALVRKANAESNVDIFIVPLISLVNATRLKQTKLLVVHDLVTVEFKNLFEKHHPYPVEVNKSLDKCLLNWQASKNTNFISHSDYVRTNHVRKNFINANDNNSFRVYLPANIDSNLLEKSKDFSVLERLNIKGPYIFYPTQIRPYKNIDTLLNAIAIIRKKLNIDLKLVLTGAVSDSRGTPELVQNLGLVNAVIELGSIAAEDLMAVYRFASGTAIPTLFEGGFPWQALEAMAVGTPVIMSKIPAVTERLGLIKVSTEDSGLLLFETKDLSGLTAHIEYMLANREQVVKSQHKLTELLLKYTWSDVAESYIKVFRKIKGLVNEINH